MDKINSSIDKLKYFQSTLLEWFNTNARIFPWRKLGMNSYQIIISEILLQRTKAETVSKFYNNFINDYPDWQSLFVAEIKNIEEYLRPIGLFKQRATRLHKLAEYMVTNNGNLPEDRGVLEKVPFMGQYIANAVELQIFNKRMPLLDVNMARVLERFFGPRKLSDIRYDPYLQDLALKIVDHIDSKKLNWAVLDFSAKVCKARKPSCFCCPLSTNCLYFISQHTNC